MTTRNYAEFYREWLLEVSSSEEGWHAILIDPSGQRANGTDGETLEEVVKFAREDIDLMVAQQHLGERFKPVIEALLAEGYKPGHVILGLHEAIGKIKHADWKNTQRYLDQAAQGFNWFD